MMENCFETTRRLVSPLSAALYYGFEPNRANFIQCPFHAEKTASLKLYENTWHCFGCGLGGSSIDFTAQLFDLSPLDAVRKMNIDFNLSLPLDQPPNETQLKAAQQRQEMLEIYRDYEKWRDGILTMLSVAYRKGHTALREVTDLNSLNQLSDEEVFAIQQRDRLGYCLDLLMSDSMEQQMEVFEERGEIIQLCNKVLNNMPLKSSVA